MKVKELLEVLAGVDPETEVILLSVSDCFYGADSRNRTHDLLITNPMTAPNILYLLEAYGAKGAISGLAGSTFAP